MPITLGPRCPQCQKGSIWRDGICAMCWNLNNASGRADQMERWPVLQENPKHGG